MQNCNRELSRCDQKEMLGESVGWLLEGEL
jgi:hypothetical protein